MQRNLLIVLSAVLFLLAADCSDPEKVNGPDEPKNTFALAPAAVYTIPAGGMVQLPDSVSGGTFSFLSGGGTLSVARILSGPKPSQPGISFWVEYTGSSLARLEFPDTPGEIQMLYGYGIDLGSIDDATGRVERWTCVPVAESLRVAPGTSAIRYELILPFDWYPPSLSAVAKGDPFSPEIRAGSWAEKFAGLLSGSGLLRTTGAASPGASGPTHTGFKAYHLARIPQNSTSAQRHAAAVRQAWGYFSAILDSLPSTVAGRITTQVASGAAYEPTFYNSEDHKYKGFLYLSDLVPITRPMIFLGPSSTDHTVAHEVGHFMNHILCGESRYLVLEAQAPAEHIPGMAHPGRAMMVEDYAHFSDYFCTGTILNANPEEPWSMFQSFTASTGLSPSAVDWPSIEGFGAVLLTALVRRSPTIRSSAGQQEDFPVIGASFGDVWMLTASGAPGMGALRDTVEAFLGRRGQKALLPVLGERIGWRYNAKGRLVNEEGKPVSGAKVQAVCTAGGRTWRTPGTVRTGADGRFSLSRLFPGESALRVWQDKDSSDVTITIPWSRPTNQEVDLGDLTVGGALLELLRKTRWIDIEFEGEIRYSDGYTRGGILLTSFMDNYDPPLWNGTSFNLEKSVTFPSGSVRVAVQGKVNATGRLLESLHATYAVTSRDYNINQLFDLRDIEVEYYDEDAVWYGLEGAVAQQHVDQMINDTTYPGQPTVSISSVNWLSTAAPPKVIIEFNIK